jgi:hypothetical protein
VKATLAGAVIGGSPIRDLVFVNLEAAMKQIDDTIKAHNGD